MVISGLVFAAHCRFSRARAKGPLKALWLVGYELTSGFLDKGVAAAQVFLPGVAFEKIKVAIDDLPILRGEMPFE